LIFVELMIEATRGGVNANSGATSTLWFCGTPSPLLLAISTTLHAAPLSMPTLARVDIVDVAIGGSTLSNSPAIGIDQ
jgi:hypothetical protein